MPFNKWKILQKRPLAGFYFSHYSYAFILQKNVNLELNRFYQKERLRKDRKSLFKKLSLPSYVCALLRKKNEVQTIKWKIVCLHKMRLKLSGRTDTSLLWIEKNRCKITKNCNCVHEMNLRFHKWWPRQ